MARHHYIVVVLCAWITTLTLLLTYYILTDRSRAADGSSKEQLSKQLQVETLRGGVDVGQGGPPPPPHFTKEKLTIAQPGDFIDHQNLSEILSAQETPDSRAAFDKVVALSSLLPKLTEISRIETPSPEAFRNYIAPAGLPVIFTDMLAGEKLGQWTWEYVRSKWGKTVYKNARQGNYSTKTSSTGKHYIKRVTVTLADFIDVVTGKRTPEEAERGVYIAKKRIIPVEALEAEFLYPPFYSAPHKKCYLEPTGWYVLCRGK